MASGVKPSIRSPPILRSPRDSVVLPQDLILEEPEENTVSEGDAWIPFSQAKDELATIITKITGKRVIVSDSFFTTANYQIVRKDRDKDKRQWLLSEQDTRYENFASKEANYTFRSSFEQTSSLTLSISKGKGFKIGAAAGGGFGGMNMGLNCGAQFNKSRSAGEGQSHSETKHLIVEIPVPSKAAVIVKELVYTTECTAGCHFYLPLGIKKATFTENLKSVLKGKDKGKSKGFEDELKKKDESEGTIKYTTSGKEEEMKVSDLLEVPDLEKKPWVCRLGDTICMRLSSECTFTKTEHTLETVYQKSDSERQKRIMKGK